MPLARRLSFHIHRSLRSWEKIHFFCSYPYTVSAYITRIVSYTRNASTTEAHKVNSKPLFSSLPTVTKMYSIINSSATSSSSVYGHFNQHDHHDHHSSGATALLVFFILAGLTTIVMGVFWIRYRRMKRLIYHSKVSFYLGEFMENFQKQQGPSIPLHITWSNTCYISMFVAGIAGRITIIFQRTDR